MLLGVQFNSKDEASYKKMIERTKIMDQIYLTHNIKQSDLKRGIQEYKLKIDADIKAL